MNQELLNQFLSLLEASSSFKLLDPEQQIAIKEAYQNVTDEQLNQGIEALKADQVATKKLADDEAHRQAEIKQMNISLKTTLKEVEKDERIDAEAADNEASQQEMQGIMQELGVADDKPKVAAIAPKKKFLGLF